MATFTGAHTLFETVSTQGDSTAYQGGCNNSYMKADWLESYWICRRTWNAVAELRKRMPDVTDSSISSLRAGPFGAYWSRADPLCSDCAQQRGSNFSSVYKIGLASNRYGTQASCMPFYIFRISQFQRF
ncbi:hypothetical protein B0J17DRAFT_633357 [Rhizoctonia solani]|nr:hypothetical protein B0J17DRAFT_633357 [Rhizoctonia solani]